MLHSRSSKLELIDLGSDYYSAKEYEDCLIKLDRVGRWLGGDQASFGAIDKMRQAPLSILDVGCGGGSFTTRLAMRYPSAKVVGIDINPQAINHAKENLFLMVNAPNNLVFECRDQGKLEEANKSFDVVISTLVCHHLSDEDLIDFISRAVGVARKKVILNDLHRNPIAFYLFKMISPICFKNRLVQHDGPLSISRGFKYNEWVNYLQSAGITPSQYSIKWKYAFRWLIEIDTERSPT